MKLNKTILLIVSGSIAAYKTPELCRLFKKQGVEIIPILTKGGAEFITPLTLASICEHKCYQDLFNLTDEAEMGHIHLARTPDAILIAPASANFMAHIAHGMATDLATSVILATNRPVFIAPAMNPFMYENMATQENINILQKRGFHMIAPESGFMACGEEGMGRMANLNMIHQTLCDYFAHHVAQQSGQKKPLTGKTAIITAGGTAEPIDPVRVITNRSTGIQGFAIADSLAKYGASVTLIYGNVTQDPQMLHPDIVKIHAPTADAMHQQVEENLPADIFISAAAVSDWKVKDYQTQKIKKQYSATNDNLYQLTLIANPDILKEISSLKNANRPKLIVGFAAETDNLQDYATQKFIKKNCDMMLANQVGNDTGFGVNNNQIYFLEKDSQENIISEQWTSMSKEKIAETLCQKIIKFFA